MLDDVVQTVQQNFPVLEVIPDVEQDHQRPVRHQHERVEGDQIADRDRVLEHAERANPEEEDERDQADDLDHGFVGHDREVRPEDALGELRELGEHPAAERPLGSDRLHGLDALDRVDLL